MMKKRDLELEKNQAMTTIADFLERYNRMIPAHFPKATTERLNQFRLANTALFRGIDGWSIEKHRKRLMDWLANFSNE